MRELGIFVDESGGDGFSDRYCLLTVMLLNATRNPRL